MRRVRGFDAKVTPRTAPEVVAEILTAIGQRRRLVIANLNLHGLYMLETSPEFAEYTKSADLCLIDGWPILKLATGPRLPARYRIGSTHWLDLLVRNDDDAEPLRIVAIGATPESSMKAAEHFNANFNVRWVGIPGYDLEQNQQRIQTEVGAADVVLVGLGMPKQEAWILANRDLLAGKVVANVGGCIDCYSGAQKWVPRWVGALGLEWLIRLLRNPRRLAHRYLVEPVRLLRLATNRYNLTNGR